MGAKASLVEGPGPDSVVLSPTLENIQAAYEGKHEEVARELIKQACCVECSAGMPRIRGVSTPEIMSQPRYWLDISPFTNYFNIQQRLVTVICLCVIKMFTHLF